MQLLNAHVPTLQVAGQVVLFLTRHLGNPVQSPALFSQIGDRFVRDVKKFAATNEVPILKLAKPNRSRWDDRKIDHAGIGDTALANGIATCEDPDALHSICDRFGPDDVQGFFDRWIAQIPTAFTETDRAACYLRPLLDTSDQPPARIELGRALKDSTTPSTTTSTTPDSAKPPETRHKVRELRPQETWCRVRRRWVPWRRRLRAGVR